LFGSLTKASGGLWVSEGASTFAEKTMDASWEGLPYWPMGLNKKMAAAYCGLSVETFQKVCPIRPVAFTGSSRGDRYIRQRLDEWLLSLDPNGQERRSLVDRLREG
jgi:hypothetical protein